MKTSSSTTPLIAAAILLLPAMLAGQQEASFDDLPDTKPHPGYLNTLSWGSGLVDTPVAWTSPGTGDVTLGSGVHGVGSLAHVATVDNVQFTGNFSLFGRLETGVTAHDGESGSIFGRAIIRRDDARGFLPGFAVGVRQITLGRSHERDRFGAKCAETQIHPNVVGCRFKESPTFYAVASNRFWLGPISATWSTGWGNGRFREVPTLEFREGSKGDAERLYNYDSDPTGLFGGFRLSVPISFPVGAVHLVGEWNGWDANTGIALEASGILVGAYVTEAEHWGQEPWDGSFYNFPKISVNFSARTNFFTGGTLATSARATRLRAEVNELRAQLEESRERVATLEGILAEGGVPSEVLAELERLRGSLEQRILEQEREIRRLQAELQLVDSTSGSSRGSR